MRVDAHTHIGPGSTHLDKSAEDLLAMLAEHRIDKALVFPSSLGLRGSPRQAAQANDFIAQAMAQYPDRIVGFAAVNPWHGSEAVAELARAATHLGLRGLKLHPPSQGFDVGDLDLLGPLFDKATELGWPVAIHCGVRVHDNPWRFGLLAEAYPDTTIIMLHANFGGTDRIGTTWVARKAANVFFETSSTSEPGFVAELMRLTDGQRVFYGSDWPWIPPRLELAIVEAAGLPEDDLARVLGNNAARALGLGQ